MKTRFNFTVICFILLLITIASNSFGQSKVLLTFFNTEIPKDKVWKLKKDTEILVQFQDFGLYSACGASIQAGFLYLIYKDSNEEHRYKIKFDELHKEPYLNEYTYSLVPRIDKDLVFNEGRVRINSCFQSIELFEYKK